MILFPQKKKKLLCPVFTKPTDPLGYLYCKHGRVLDFTD